MTTLLLLPLIAFVLILLVVAGASAAASLLAPKATAQAAGKDKAYACGEDYPIHQGQPEYSEFFPFAIFFTLMHVVALIAATVPGGSLQIALLAVLYLLAAIIGLGILYRS